MGICSVAPGSHNSPIVNNVVIIGVGLMGGSLGLALHATNAACTVTGVDCIETLQAAREAGAIDNGHVDPSEAVLDADLIVIATPVHAIRSVIANIAPMVRSDAYVTDLGSVKSGIVKCGSQLLGDRFIGGHPMAGSEQTGIASARESLYSGGAWALTPPEDTMPEHPALLLMSQIITAIGARPLIMTAERHDRAAALISHLPHLISFAYNHTIDSDADRELAIELAAGSYRDLTRVAASDPVLWRDVFIENREWLLEVLAAFKISITELESAVYTADPQTVLNSILNASRRA